MAPHLFGNDALRTAQRAKHPVKGTSKNAIFAHRPDLLTSGGVFMGQMGFFDLSKRYTGLDAKNEPLAKIDEVYVPGTKMGNIPPGFRILRIGRTPSLSCAHSPRRASRAGTAAGGCSIVAVPKQRNSRKENAGIRAGETPECWQDKPAKRRQKDCRRILSGVPMRGRTSSVRTAEVHTLSHSRAAAPPLDRSGTCRSWRVIAVSASNLSDASLDANRIINGTGRTRRPGRLNQ